MTERLNDKRVSFRNGSQAKFFNLVKKKLNISSTKKLAQIMGIHPRTLNDWERGGTSVSLYFLEKICHVSKIEIPKNIEVKERYWYTRVGIAGANALHQKYGNSVGDTTYRRQKWNEWWNTNGKYKNRVIGVAKPTATPAISADLAEFVGIVMGDGAITKYQVTITLNSKDDREYLFVIVKLIKKLFNVTPGIFYEKKRNAVNIYLSRIKIVEYLTTVLGLKIGHKLKSAIEIPQWIKKNRLYQKAFIRGLIDTDGCIYYEKHRLKNKTYSYPRLNFVNSSPGLINAVFDILNDLNLNPRIRRSGKAVQVENMDDIWHYFKVIGTSNPKHEDRWLRGLKR